MGCRCQATLGEVSEYKVRVFMKQSCDGGLTERNSETMTPEELKDPQAFLKKDAKLNDALDAALLEALKEIEAETLSAQQDLSIPGYEDSLFSSLPATNPNFPDPTALPLKPSRSTSYESLPEDQWHATLVRGRSVQPAYHHKPVYRYPAALLHLRSHHPKLLDFFCHFAEHAAASLGIPASHTVHLPTQRSLWTVPRGPFVHKKSQENFERRTHKRAIKAWDTDPEVIDRWLAYLRKHALGGVGMRVIKWERAPLGVGQKQVQEVKTTLASAKIKNLAAKIVKEEQKAEGAVAAAN